MISVTFFVNNDSSRTGKLGHQKSRLFSIFDINSENGYPDTKIEQTFLDSHTIWIPELLYLNSKMIS